MESTCIAGCIQVSEKTHELLVDSGLHILKERGVINLKGIGTMKTFWIQGASLKNAVANFDALETVLGSVKQLSAVPVPATTSLSKISSVAQYEANATSSSSSKHLNLRRSQALGLFLENKLSSSPQHGSQLKKRYSEEDLCGALDQKKREGRNVIHILVVEDSLVQQKLVCRKINEAAGILQEVWKTVVASNGEDALKIVEESEYLFDLIFIDQILSNNGLSGNDVLEILRGVNHLNDTFIIGMVSNKINTRKMIQAGANLVWSKPIPSGQEIASRLQSAGLCNRFTRSGKAQNYEEEEDVELSLMNYARDGEGFVSTVVAAEVLEEGLDISHNLMPLIDTIEPDLDLIRVLINSQQNFSISDPSLPDNPLMVSFDLFFLLSPPPSQLKPPNTTTAPRTLP